MTAPVMPLTAEAQQRRFTARFELLRALMRHRSGLVGIGILTFFTLLAIFPDLLVGELQTAVTAPGTRLEPPSAAFPTSWADRCSTSPSTRRASRWSSASSRPS
jgi:hypothetical protein